jgi:hypothetical protein
MNAIEEFAYVKLIAALKGIASGKDMHDHIVADGGRGFEIAKVLSFATFLKGDFAGDHVDDAKAAFAVRKLSYPGDSTIQRVELLVEPVVGRNPGIDRTADRLYGGSFHGRASMADRSSLSWRPKKRGPFHLVPVIAKATLERLS